MKGKSREDFIKRRGNKCEQCGISEWLGKPLPLEVHHKDGDHTNDDENNLIVLCPNCHSLTESFCKKVKNTQISDEEFIQALQKAKTIHQALLSLNMSTAGANYARARNLIQQYNLTHLFQKEKQEHYCIDCGAPIGEDSLRCPKCASISLRQFEIERAELKRLIRETPFTQIGKQYGVSDNAIRRRCRLLNLPSRKADIKKYSDEEWEKI